MKNRLLISSSLFCVLMYISPFTQAQTYTLDWGSSFTPAWASGNTSGTALNIGGSGINCVVAMNLVGSGSMVAPYPRVNNNNTAGGDFEVQGSTDAIEVDINMGNRTSYYNIVFTFSSPVNNIAFALSDLDRPNGASPWTYSDYVTVTATGPGGAVTPTLSEYNPAATIVNVAGNTGSANNGASGGNVSSLNQGSPYQDGTVLVNFGSNLISTFTIQYGTQNIAQVNADPGLQAIAIGNLSFDLSGTLPIKLLDFSGRSFQDDIQLAWKTAEELNACCFEIEHSKDNTVFNTVGTVQAKNSGNVISDYSFIHSSPSNGNNYYRLKMIDTDRSFVYSKTIVVQLKIETLSMNQFQNPFNGSFQAQVNCTHRCDLQVELIDMQGRLHYKQTLQRVEGSIPLRIETSKLAAGQYVLILNDGIQNVSYKLIKGF